MPLFDYICETCGSQKNELVKTPNENVLCERCQTAMTKFFPRSSFYLKGRGWAPDNYNKPKDTPKPTQSD